MYRGGGVDAACCTADVTFEDPAARCTVRSAFVPERFVSAFALYLAQRNLVVPKETYSPIFRRGAAHPCRGRSPKFALQLCTRASLPNPTCRKLQGIGELQEAFRALKVCI